MVACVGGIGFQFEIERAQGDLKSRGVGNGELDADSGVGPQGPGTGGPIRTAVDLVVPRRCVVEQNKRATRSAGALDAESIRQEEVRPPPPRNGPGVERQASDAETGRK